MSWWSDLWKPKPVAPVVDMERGWCVPDSVFCALAWMIKRKVPVRIAAQHIEPGIDHVQAQAKIDGKWVPLTELWDNTSIYVRTWTQHFPGEPYRYMTLKEFFNEQYEIFKQEGL